MLSIIIPTLNEERLITATLSQFTAEIREAFHLKIILSDGGSADLTREIASDFNVEIVTHTKERRQTIAEGRNRGAEHASGELLMFLNADTRFVNTEKFFLALVETMRDPSVVAATCAVQIFPEEEIAIDRLFHLVHNAYCRFLNLIGEGMGRGECQIIRKEIFDRVGGYNESIAAGEDYDLFRRVRRLGKISFLKKIILYESPRRFRKYGYARIVWGWTRNALSVSLRNKSSSEEWEAVR